MGQPKSRGANLTPHPPPPPSVTKQRPGGDPLRSPAQWPVVAAKRALRSVPARGLNWNKGRRSTAPPTYRPPPPLRVRRTIPQGKFKFCEGKQGLGVSWYTNLWIPGRPLLRWGGGGGEVRAGS